MQTVVMCSQEEFCCHQKETGGDIRMGTYNKIEYWCMATPCQYPGKLCLYIKMGGKRPQEGE